MIVGICYRKFSLKKAYIAQGALESTLYGIFLCIVFSVEKIEMFISEYVDFRFEHKRWATYCSM